MTTRLRWVCGWGVAGLAASMTVWTVKPASAQVADPALVDDRLAVRTVVSGLNQPTTMAFLGDNDFFVLEKSTGQVKRVVDGTASVVLDLGVNSSSERGLLGIALDPEFPLIPSVYLYWTCTAPAPSEVDPFTPTLTECADPPADPTDSTNILAVPLLGNRVDRFIWNESTSAFLFDRNLIKLRVFQNDGAPVPPGQGDEEQPPAGNHDGGVIRFGHDEKLYVITGDTGRRGQLQNLIGGPTPPLPDDQFGGPQPDDAHLTGVILRLNPVDGSAPEDNPFFEVGAAMGGEVGQNIQKIFAYGIRNSFGMAFDPISGNLWTQENGDDSFDELNLVDPGSNSGWIQIMGPVSRIDEFKAIEVTRPPSTLQQLRWPPTNLANSPQEALSRLFMLPGAHYSDPEFSWKFAVAPAAIGFIEGSALGSRYNGDMIVGASRTFLEGGYLFNLKLSGNRRKFVLGGKGLQDDVADNLDKFDLTESEPLLFGRDFGVGTDIQTGPNGNLFVVSLSNGAVYEIYQP